MNKVIPAPSKPWQPTFVDRLEDLLIIVGSLGIAGATVKLTGLNGKLGYFFAFFFTLLIASFVFHFFKRGLQAAKDSVLKVLTAMAIFVTLIPIVSIVATVVSKGYKGLHWGLLTKDMALASVNDPIANGGLLRLAAKHKRQRQTLVNHRKSERGLAQA